ncbi:MAG TPA: glycosyltransferase [Planctomycetota bacterium]|nr:glycosyltransferase [Planctomycetota bacterium]
MASQTGSTTPTPAHPERSQASAASAAESKGAKSPAVSIVIPVFNEEANLPNLWKRLKPVMDGLEAKGGVEAVFTDDGSRDRSLEILKQMAAEDRRVKVVAFNRNYGQHAAIFAAFDRVRGDVVVTLDADLQNPPEEIPKLVDKAREGYDVVGGWREARKDTAFRRYASLVTNRMMVKAIGVDLHDFGCMLRAYSHDVVDCMRQCQERSSFIPALACQFARRPTEIRVAHAEREAGESKYSLWKLVKLQADLVTGFSTIPLRAVTFSGVAIALTSIAFGAFLLIERLIRGPEWAAYGVFTLFAILFFMIGCLFFGMGMLGEYVGRIYNEVRKRPRGVVKETVNI